MMVSLLLEEEIMKYVFLYICVCIWERMNGFTHIHGKTSTKKGEVYVYISICSG